MDCQLVDILSGYPEIRLSLGRIGLFLARRMIYPPLSLSGVGLVVGLFLAVLSGLCLRKPEQMKRLMKAMPRSRPLGIVLLTTAAVWSFYLVRTMDLGEFSSYRTAFTIVVPIAYYLTLTYVDEFLTARALGILLLLLSELIIEAAFLKPQISRLLIVVIAYLAIVKGMFFVGMPYLMRDGIHWLTSTDFRWRASLWVGLAYGMIVIVASLTLFR
jgi:hypothetical protein